MPDAQFQRRLPLVAVASPNETERRAKLARLALAVAASLSALFCALTFFILPGVHAIPILDAMAFVVYGSGYVAAQSGRFTTARAFLIGGAIVHIALLILFTGSALASAIYAFALGQLAIHVYTRAEWAQRWLVMAASFVLIVVGFVVGDGISSLAEVPRSFALTTRVLNISLTFAGALLLHRTFDAKVARSEAALIAERDRSTRLLHAVLPHKIAALLEDGRRQMVADFHPEVTVLFADIVGFTPWAAAQEPEAVVQRLQDLFSRFDAHVEQHGAEKIKTIGDAYMVIAGAPDSRGDHAATIARLAVALLEEVNCVRAETGMSFDLRVGIHSGPVIAGVIGTMRFSYDVWGDTVNTASRMESTGLPGRIQVSARTREQLLDEFAFEPRGTIDVKGKGTMDTWWLLGPRA